MTYELDLETHTDTYGINLAEDGLTLTAVQNGGTLLRENTPLRATAR